MPRVNRWILLGAIAALFLLCVWTHRGEALQSLPGIGEVLAERIVEYRAENGPFASVDELDNVYGIGEGKLASIRPFLTAE